MEDLPQSIRSTVKDTSREQSLLWLLRATGKVISKKNPNLHSQVQEIMGTIKVLRKDNSWQVTYMRNRIQETDVMDLSRFKFYHVNRSGNEPDVGKRNLEEAVKWWRSRLDETGLSETHIDSEKNHIHSMDILLLQFVSFWFVLSVSIFIWDFSLISLIIAVFFRIILGRKLLKPILTSFVLKFDYLGVMLALPLMTLIFLNSSTILLISALIFVMLCHEFSYHVIKYRENKWHKILQTMWLTYLLYLDGVVVVRDLNVIKYHVLIINILFIFSIFTRGNELRLKTSKLRMAAYSCIFIAILYLELDQTSNLYGVLKVIVIILILYFSTIYSNYSIETRLSLSICLPILAQDSILGTTKALILLLTLSFIVPRRATKI